MRLWIGIKEKNRILVKKFEVNSQNNLASSKIRMRIIRIVLFSIVWFSCLMCLKGIDLREEMKQFCKHLSISPTELLTVCFNHLTQKFCSVPLLGFFLRESLKPICLCLLYSFIYFYAAYFSYSFPFFIFLSLEVG